MFEMVIQVYLGVLKNPQELEKAKTAIQNDIKNMYANMLTDNHFNEQTYRYYTLYVKAN